MSMSISIAALQSSVDAGEGFATIASFKELSSSRFTCFESEELGLSTEFDSIFEIARFPSMVEEPVAGNVLSVATYFTTDPVPFR